MAASDRKVDLRAGVARRTWSRSLAPATGLTDAIVGLQQVWHPFVVEGVQTYARVRAGTVSVTPGLVRPGSPVEAVVLSLATTTTRFQLAAVSVLTPIAANPQANVPLLFRKAAEDNIAFSQNATINGGAVAGQWWGAVRVQMDAAGVVSTKVVAQDQRFATEADAISAMPPADADKVDLGYITIRSAAGATFTLNTTALNAGGTTVNYVGRASGIVNVVTAAVTFATATPVLGTMVAVQRTRACAQRGGLLVLRVTTDGSGALTDGEVHVQYRVYGLDAEVLA